MTNYFYLHMWLYFSHVSTIRFFSLDFTVLNHVWLGHFCTQDINWYSLTSPSCPQKPEHLLLLRLGNWWLYVRNLIDSLTMLHLVFLICKSAKLMCYIDIYISRIEFSPFLNPCKSLSWLNFLKNGRRCQKNYVCAIFLEPFRIL